MATAVEIAAAKTYLLSGGSDRATAINHYHTIKNSGQYSSAEMSYWYELVMISGDYGLITRDAQGEVTFDSRLITPFKVGMVSNSNGSVATLANLVANKQLYGHLSVGTFRRSLPHSGNPIPYDEGGLFSYLTYTAPNSGLAIQIRSLEYLEMTTNTNITGGNYRPISGAMIAPAVVTETGVYDVITYGEFA